MAERTAFTFESLLGQVAVAVMCDRRTMSAMNPRRAVTALVVPFYVACRAHTALIFGIDRADQCF